MHNKFCVINNKILINGFYNWTYYAEDRNRENVLIIDGEEETV
jgi:phosphatidylserine/phosphatidylglycerophosphate/cardiolipin synthase-like enzyme